MTENEQLFAAIGACLNGNPSDYERFTADEWLAGDPHRQSLYEKLEHFDCGAYINRQADEAKERIFARIENTIYKRTYARKVRMWQFVAVAAATVALLFVVADKYLITNKLPQPSVQMVNINSPAGLVSVLSLPDNTVVRLNAGSSLAYPAEFDTVSRTVHLTGEGLFDVATDSLHPFIVEAGGLKVRALGTKFNIKSYSDENEVVTTLVEGSVQVESRDSAIVLMPDEQLIYSKKSNSSSKSNVDAAMFVLWAENQLVFDNVRFDEMVKILSRAYGVKITLKSNKLAAMPYSGILSKGLGLKAILSSLEKRWNFAVTYHDSEIEIVEKR